MTQPSRTTESISRDNAAIREIMLQIRQLTVPDRATLAVGLIGHLATLMNRSQMSKLMAELQEQTTRVQDVPPSRQRDQTEQHAESEHAPAATPRGEVQAAGPQRSDRTDERDNSAMRARGGHEGVGQAGRGEFLSRELL